MGRPAPSTNAPRVAPRQLAGFAAPLIVLSLALAAVAVVFGSTPLPSLAAGATFTLRFSANDTGDVVVAANTIMTCSGRPNQCPDAQKGQGGLANLNNDMYSTAYVDGDAATSGLFNSAARKPLPGPNSDMGVRFTS